MIPNYYVCTSCLEKFEFRFRDACYFIGTEPLGKKVTEADLLPTPARPAWCNHCEAMCLVEDIASSRDFESAYAAVRSGLPIDYPIASANFESTQAEAIAGNFLRWRISRRRDARALCCGRENYQFMDVAQPLFKHAGCEFGFIEPAFYIGSYCGPGPGVLSPANMPVYSTEGELVGLLTCRKQGDVLWEVEPLNYPASSDDD